MDARRYLGNFLKSADIKAPTPLTIAGCRAEKLQDDECLVMDFIGMPKGLVLNATNIETCVGLFGEETNAWAGQFIVVYVDDKVQYQGKLVKGLRLREYVIPQTPPAPPWPAAEPSPARQIADSVGGRVVDETHQGAPMHPPVDGQSW
jgi:hypothetical protein